MSGLQPNLGKLVLALRAIGYSIEQAAADIIDNSISAVAATVLVDLEVHEDQITRVMFLDDGKGMTGAGLQEAMRFGTEGDKEPGSLGKYGMGMKLASLSQGEELIVASRKDGEITGRRWTVEGISDNWRCDEIPTDQVEALLGRGDGKISLVPHGTVVCWNRLDRIRGKGKAEHTAENILERLSTHLGMHFHRFLENEKVRILLRISNKKGASASLKGVAALNPFRTSSGESGREDYPKIFRLEMPGIGELSLNGHIWPPNSKEKNYRLDGRASSRQGLYFYRRDRLIQAGGWNDGRNAEPHLSLARVAIDLPQSMDDKFALDVKKSGIREPDAFREALKGARAADGTKFSDYRHIAEDVYRRAARKNPDNFPLVPAIGIRTSLRGRLERLLVPSGGRTRKVAIKWTDLDEGEVFRLERERKEILLNVRMRPQILDGRPASATDAQVFKVLLFLLVMEDLDSGRVAKQQTEKLEQINAILRTSLKDY